MNCHCHPNYELETALIENCKRPIAGVDEVGRGPLAGPVVAAAVILDPENIPDGIADSKTLTAAKRLQLYGLICKNADIAVAHCGAETIDTINIRQASLDAMAAAVLALPVQPFAVLIDGRDVPEKLGGIGRAIIGGDGLCVSIAAASIVAKVIRDQMLVDCDRSYPGYGFSKNKGYGTQAHRDALDARGPCRLHRKSFKPISQG